jgi:nucleoside-diphosphate-sugar epimerase
VGGFNVGTGQETDVNQLASALLAAAAAPVPVNHEAARPGEQRRSVIDPGKLSAQGWKPSVTVAEGLARTYRWFAEQRNKV